MKHQFFKDVNYLNKYRDIIDKESYNVIKDLIIYHLYNKTRNGSLVKKVLGSIVDYTTAIQPPIVLIRFIKYFILLFIVLAITYYFGYSLLLKEPSLYAHVVMPCIFLSIIYHIFTLKTYNKTYVHYRVNITNLVVNECLKNNITLHEDVKIGNAFLSMLVTDLILLYFEDYIRRNKSK